MQAFNVAKKALQVTEKNGGQNDPDVATNLNNLVGVYEALSQLLVAEPTYKRALEICEKNFSPIIFLRERHQTILQCFPLRGAVT